MKFDSVPTLDDEGHSIAFSLYGYFKDNEFHDDVPAYQGNPEACLAFFVWMCHMLGASHNMKYYEEWTDRQIFNYMKSEYCKFKPYEPLVVHQPWYRRII